MMYDFPISVATLVDPANKVNSYQKSHIQIV